MEKRLVSPVPQGITQSYCCYPQFGMLEIKTVLDSEAPYNIAVCAGSAEGISRQDPSRAHALCPSDNIPWRSARMSAKIHIERMMYRSSIAVPGESAASYA